MAIGAALLTGLWGGSNLNAWVVMYGFSLFIYGIGVGGEVRPPFLLSILSSLAHFASPA
jgi:hypothetical protein